AFIFAGNVGDDGGRQRPQIRQLVLDEVVDAVVIQADGVEHAGGRFDRARRGVAGARGVGNSLGDDAAELGEVHDAGHVARVAEGAGGNEDGVAQMQTTNLGGK